MIRKYDVMRHVTSYTSAKSSTGRPTKIRFRLKISEKHFSKTIVNEVTT